MDIVKQNCITTFGGSVGKSAWSAYRAQGMMKIAVLDADLIARKQHRFPNLVCMETSGYHKSGENDVHYGFIEAFIERLSEKYNIREIVFERRDAVQMVQNLEGMSFTVVPFG